MERDVRVSPNGDLVACASGDAITTFDRKGKRHVVSRGWRIDELAWSPQGDEIIFTGARSDSRVAIRAVSLSGRDRLLVPGPGPSDWSFTTLPLTAAFSSKAESRAVDSLVDREARITSASSGPFRIRFRPISLRTANSSCSSMEARSAGDRTGIYLGRTDGTPAVRLGAGHAEELSADGKWYSVG